MSTEPRGEGGRRALEDLLDATRADPELTPSERETTFTFAVDEDVAHIHTEEAAVIRLVTRRRPRRPAGRVRR